jgi:hypothetical protein
VVLQEAERGRNGYLWLRAHGSRQATEQIMDLCYTLRMMVIPLDGPAWMFGDNQSVITSSNIPHSSLNKRHNVLFYHRVREAISGKILYFIHIDGKLYPSDILTKFLSWAKLWPLIKPMLFWKAETIKDINPNLQRWSTFRTKWSDKYKPR